MRWARLLRDVLLHRLLDLPGEDFLHGFELVALAFFAEEIIERGELGGGANGFLIPRHRLFCRPCWSPSFHNFTASAARKGQLVRRGLLGFLAESVKDQNAALLRAEQDVNFAAANRSAIRAPLAPITPPPYTASTVPARPSAYARRDPAG